MMDLELPSHHRELTQEHDDWIREHQKKSIRHSRYFAGVIAYVAFDIISRFL